MNRVEKEIKAEWEKQLTQHIQGANINIKELLMEYLEYKQAEEAETHQPTRRAFYKDIKRDKAVDIVEFLLSEKELMEKVKKFMDNKRKH